MIYDAIIVGARCAGASLAMLLARQGARVLLVDRATFPCDIPHGHFIHRHGPRRLRDWGLLDRVASRTPAISRMVNDMGDFPLRVENLVEDDVAWGYGPRRSTFDKILVDAASESGAELRENFCVTGHLFDADAMVGIRGRQPGGGEAEERATITIGADGRRSPLRGQHCDGPLHAGAAGGARAACRGQKPASARHHFHQGADGNDRSQHFLRSAEPAASHGGAVGLGRSGLKRPGGATEADGRR
jgi:2-polyprenyl-6-methoxyphenol hydroxylase-like FAD-dependent oxidoreductase